MPDAEMREALGGEIRTNTVINDLAQLRKTRLILLDVPPRQLLHIAGNRIPKSIDENCSVIDAAREYSKSTMLLMLPFHGLPKSAEAPARFILVAPSARLQKQN
jgi:hypothetical protein